MIVLQLTLREINPQANNIQFLSDNRTLIVVIVLLLLFCVNVTPK